MQLFTPQHAAISVLSTELVIPTVVKSNNHVAKICTEVLIALKIMLQPSVSL